MNKSIAMLVFSAMVIAYLFGKEPELKSERSIIVAQNNVSQIWKPFDRFKKR